MRLRPWFPLVAALLLALAPYDALLAQPSSRLVIIGTGGKAGVYYPAGGAICKLVNAGRWQHGTRCVASSTQGSVANLRAIQSGTLDFALAQSDAHHEAVNGTGAFADSGPLDNVRSLFSLHAEPFTVVARRDAGVSGIAELRGTRVNIGNPGSGQRKTMQALMQAMGWTADDFTVATEFSSAEQAQALCNNQIDVIVFTVGHPNRSIHDALTSCGGVLVPVSGEAIDRLVDESGYFQKMAIPGGIYNGHADDVPTFGVRATVVASASADTQIVYWLMEAVFTNLHVLRSAHPALHALSEKEMVRDGLAARLHSGALLYYAEMAQR